MTGGLQQSREESCNRMIQDLHRATDLIERDWQHAHVVILGDVMLDSYLWGDVDRISPEAPVPVVRAVHRTQRPGGAANVAMNVTGLGARSTLVGVRGDDAEGILLEQSVREAGISPRLTVVPGYPTTMKLRILGGQQQMLRLDTERVDGYPSDVYRQVLRLIEEVLPDADALVLSDYAKGLLTEDLCQQAIRKARQAGVPVLVDPKRRSFTAYRGATTICPNLSELAQVTGVIQSDTEALLAAGQSLVSQLGIDYLTATMSNKGIAVLRPDSRFLAPARARQVFDVSGAGDTVMATLALAVSSNLSIETAAQLANVAAGVVVAKVGTVPVTRDELLTSLTPELELHAQEKVLALDHLTVRASAWRAGGQRIVFTNGCFDILHIGHITLLEHARGEGDRLIVAINSDSSVRSLKGPKRPVVGERERARILAALAAVDAVIIFDEQTPLRVIEELRPDVIVKGGDYNEDTVVGAKEIRSWGGCVRIVPLVEGFSTTKIIDKAK
jgi:D-beta-D-heptose 7-phosphate kinase/D-beta-D-heptose 1-phosphate adenosyltransferase